MRMFITSKNKYLSNDMKIFGTCSIPLIIWQNYYQYLKIFNKVQVSDVDKTKANYIGSLKGSFHLI